MTYCKNLLFNTEYILQRHKQLKQPLSRNELQRNLWMALEDLSTLIARFS